MYHTDELSLRLLEKTQAPITPYQGYVCADMDTFVMDNSGSSKEQVARTYQGVDGYAPIAVYLGNEGWNLGLELRNGSQHSAAETQHFLAEVFPRIERLSPKDTPVLFRDECGFDSARLLFAKASECERYEQIDRAFEFLTKWNPRKQNKDQWVLRAHQRDAFKQERSGKRVALLDETVTRKWSGQTRQFRLVVRVIERTIDKKGQHFLEPQITLEGWWTSLSEPMEQVIKLYQHHGLHEQYHSEFKTDLDLERLSSGKFSTNDAITHLAAFSYNCLRLIGQLGLTGEISKVRSPAKRRRIKTVLQEIMYRAAKHVLHACKRILDFGGSCGWYVKVFNYLQTKLHQASSP